MTAQAPVPQDAKVVSYSNVTPEGVTLHFDRPVHQVRGGLHSETWWISWRQLGGALVSDWYHECPPARKDEALRQAKALIATLIPEPADHAPAEGADLDRGAEWVACSETESGHPAGQCPIDGADDGLIVFDDEWDLTFGQVRAVLAAIDAVLR